jgi:hypothetical protein
MDRQELIEYVEKNKLKKVLRQRVIDKWEEIEDSIKVERTTKYGEDEE